MRTYQLVCYTRGPDKRMAEVGRFFLNEVNSISLNSDGKVTVVPWLPKTMVPCDLVLVKGEGDR